MTVNELPLQAENQQFTSVINNVSYLFRILWRGEGWVLDIMDNAATPLICGLSLVPGSNLLAQHQSRFPDIALYVVCDKPGQHYPTADDLGSGSHLYIVTE